MLSLFPRDVLDEIWDLIESVSVGYLLPTFSHSGQLFTLYGIEFVSSTSPTVFNRSFSDLAYIV